MATVRTHPIENFARLHHRTAARWLRRKFAAKLTDDDIADVLSETYGAALEAGTGEFAEDRMRAWVYRAAYFRAIAVIREREGRGRARERTASLEDEVDRTGLQLADASSDFAARMGEATLLAHTQLVSEALEKLPANERRVLRYTLVDGLSVRSAAALLGMGKSSIDRINRRGLERLTTMCSAAQSEDCAHARQLLSADHPLSGEMAGWREAHLAGCLACQVVAGRRVHILLPLLPVGGPGALAHLTAKFTALGTVGAATGAKVAATVVVAAGVAVAPQAVSSPDRPERRDAVVRPAAPAAAAAAPVATPTPTPDAAPASAPAEKTGSHRADEDSAGRKRRSSRKRRRHADEFSPESAAPAASPIPTANSAPAVPPAPEPAPSTPPGPRYAPSGSTQEFAP